MVIADTMKLWIIGAVGALFIAAILTLPFKSDGKIIINKTAPTCDLAKETISLTAAEIGSLIIKMNDDNLSVVEKSIATVKYLALMDYQAAAIRWQADNCKEA